MHITNQAGDALKLTITNYQFPEHTGGGTDANWLMIQIDATINHRSWMITDPCLLTVEVQRLADWLRALVDTHTSHSRCGFIEPCLSFVLHTLNNKNRVLRVYFELEARPAWAKATGAGPEDLWIDFPLEEIDVQQAAVELYRQLSRYPTRNAA